MRTLQSHNGDKPMSESEPQQMNQENQEHQELRTTLIDVADRVLLESADRTRLESLDDQQLIEAIQQDFQQELRSFYQDSGLAAMVQQTKAETSDIPLDERLLDLIGEEAGKKPDEESHWSHRAFPKLIKQQPGKGYECTVAGAMLKMAFEDAELGDTRSMHMKGHQVVVRRLPDKSLKIYDPATRHTDKESGKQHGFSTVIQPDEIVEHQRVDEGHRRAGDAFTVRTNGDHPDSEIFAEKDADGYAAKRFYAYDPSIYVDASVFLSNLSEVKDDAKKPDNRDAQQLIQQYPELEKLNWGKIKGSFQIFDSHDHLKQ
jgi:hypothetical protein